MQALCGKTGSSKMKRTAFLKNQCAEFRTIFDITSYYRKQLIMVPYNM